MTELAAHLGPFLREHLPRDRGASPNTVETYAYSFQLLACFTAERPRYVACNISVHMLRSVLCCGSLNTFGWAVASCESPQHNIRDTARIWWPGVRP